MSHRSGKFPQPTKSNVFLFCTSMALAKYERQGFQPVSQQFALRTRPPFHDLLRQFPLSCRGEGGASTISRNNSLHCGNQDAPSKISCSNLLSHIAEDGVPMMSRNNSSPACHKHSVSTLSRNNSYRRATIENNHSCHETRLTEPAAVAPARLRARKDSEIWEIREFARRNALR